MRRDAEGLLERPREVRLGHAAHPREAPDGPLLVRGGVHPILRAEQAAQQLRVLTTHDPANLSGYAARVLPISDSPRDPAHRPWATLVLIAANVAVGAVTLPLAYVAWEPASPLPGVPEGAQLDQLFWVAYTFGARPSAPSLTTTLTAMFLHAGVLHLAGNMLYLWIYGPNVERRLGSVPFVLLYVTAGLLGTLLFTLVSLGSPRPSIGASGAISGVLGAYLVFFPVNTIRVLLYVFRNNLFPTCPFPSPGLDPTEDDLPGCGEL